MNQSKRVRRYSSSECYKIAHAEGIRKRADMNRKKAMEVAGRYYYEVKASELRGAAARGLDWDEMELSQNSPKQK